MVICSPFFVFLLLVPFAAAEFYYPPQKGRGVFKVGQVETITYRTSYKEYTIAVWQQNLHQGAAGLGPIIYQTTDGPKGRFDWLVQTYDFNLQASNVFFFWLFEGNASAQGNQSLASMSSSFFNITDAAEQPTTLPSTSLVPTTTSSSSAAPTNSSHDQENKNSNQLSAGAIAGISIGAGLAVLGIGVGIAVVFWLKHQKKKKHPENTPQSIQAYPPSYYDQSWKPPPQQPYRPPRSPIEMGT